MKWIYPLVIILSIAQFSIAQSAPDSDITKRMAQDRLLTAVEEPPAYPGGMDNFFRYLSKNLKYPDVARLIGINGKLRLTFVIDRDGSVKEVTPKNCIGAGCEAEAVKLLEGSPKWLPGIQNGRAVRVQYTVPITFTADQGKVTLKSLRKSDYGFVFNIKGALYTIDEAEKLIGDSFMSQQVDIAEPFFNYNKIAKFDIPNKKEVYLIILKST